MNSLQAYKNWLNHPGLPEDLHQELQSIEGNEEEIEERFGRNLHFGTAGLRGVLGAGLNRMNIFIVRRTSWAFANYVLHQDHDAASRGIVIGYDCRHMSSEFAREAALAMAAAGVKAFVSPVLCPTPEVSFSVRHLRAVGGVMITASHNPPEYNGYKVYGPDGGQLLPDATTGIRKILTEHDDVFHIPTMRLDEAIRRGLFQWIESDVRMTYIETVVDEILFPSVSDEARKDLQVVYTPLHGAGNVPVRKTLEEAGYAQVIVVKEQEAPNGDFPTVKSPNPEDPEALELGIRTAREVTADLVMGTDPDSDRVGIAVRDAGGNYQLLTGNQVGALLIDFIASRRKAEGRLPSNGIVFKTIVTSELGRTVAEANGITVENTLTGFKYIGNRITHYESTGEYAFLFGYEESYGYLVSPMVRDKDAVQTCLAIAEMTAYYKIQEKSLLDALHGLFSRFGYFTQVEFSVALDPQNANAERQSVMSGFRKETPSVEGLTMVAVEDYSSSERRQLDESGNPTGKVESLPLPESDVLKYMFEDGSWAAIRPSGTEPKIKVYLAARGTSQTDCEIKTKQMRAAIEKHVKSRMA